MEDLSPMSKSRLRLARCLDRQVRRKEEGDLPRRQQRLKTVLRVLKCVDWKVVHQLNQVKEHRSLHLLVWKYQRNYLSSWMRNPVKKWSLLWSKGKRQQYRGNRILQGALLPFWCQVSNRKNSQHPSNLNMNQSSSNLFRPKNNKLL